MANGQTRAQNIGLGLQGFGAGIQGNLPQFQANLNQRQQFAAQEQQRQQTLEEERQKTFFLDAKASLDLLNDSNFEGLVGLGAQRLQALQNFPGADPSDTQRLMQLSIAAKNGSDEAEKLLRSELETAVSIGTSLGVLEEPEAPEDFTLAKGAQRFDSFGNLIASNIPEEVVEEPDREIMKDVQDRPRFVDTGELVFPDVEEEAAPKAPEALLVGLEGETRARAEAAFAEAGGGNVGIEALNKAAEFGEEVELRADVPRLLTESFPNASNAERKQLESAVAAARTVGAGLTSAGKIREEQKRLKKAQTFQKRAIDLLTGIINNPELDDVTGKFEGGLIGAAVRPFKLLDVVETDLIADITEAEDILTTDNMDLMTGVLSESDIQLLKNLSAGALNRKRSGAAFKKAATELLTTLSSRLVETVDDIVTPDAGPRVIEFNADGTRKN